MKLVRYNPNRQLRTHNHNFTDMFDGLFDDFFGPVLTTGNIPAGRVGTSNMKMDIYEKEDAYVLEADLPGMKKEEISLDVKGKTITISGERKREEEIKEENRIRMERSSGTFSRSFTLPYEIDAEHVTATFHDGVLRLEVTKPEEKKPKKIEIQ